MCVCECIIYIYRESYFKEVADTVVGSGKSEIHMADQ